MVLPSGDSIAQDGHRNDAQKDAIEKALTNRTVFIWGPPGTGKTATLGYIIANYLEQGKSVLFASNTNRAVDVGTAEHPSCAENSGPNITQNKTYPVWGSSAV